MQAILDRVAEGPSFDPGQASIHEMRRMLDDGTAMLAQLGTEPVAATEDRTIEGPGGDLALRCYRPEGTGPFGVVVFFHGGAFAMGSLDSHDALCRSLTHRSGALVVSVDYRLAPEDPFPAGVEDAWAALRWVAANAATLGGDPGRLAVAGDSAGGTLAAVVALRARDEGGPDLALQALVYPGADPAGDYPSAVECAEGYLYTTPMRTWFFDQYAPPEVDRTHWWMSPLRAASHEGVAPALVVTAEYDPLRDEGEAYASALTDAGIPTRLSRYDGMCHGFFSYGALIAAADRAVDEVAAALRTALA